MNETEKLKNDEAPAESDLMKLLDAFCLVEIGWRTELEHKKYLDARDLIWKRGRFIQLQNELEALK